MTVEKIAPLRAEPLKFRHLFYGAILCALLASILLATVIVSRKLDTITSVLAGREFHTNWTSSRKVLLKANADSSWTYSRQDLWPGNCTTGSLQSPIALQTSDCLESDESLSLTLTNVDGYFVGEVGNDGHSVEVRLDSYLSSVKPKVSGAGLNGSFTLDNVHFHWPSEHTIDGVQYDLEAHFVFYSDSYANLSEATNYPYGITVVGVLYQASAAAANSAVTIIGDAVTKVSATPDSFAYSSDAFQISQLFPADANEEFFRFTGSLTTPDCTEYVNWIVVKNPRKVPSAALTKLTTIYTTSGTLLTYNNRDLQNVNSRTIQLAG